MSEKRDFVTILLCGFIGAAAAGSPGVQAKGSQNEVVRGELGEKLHEYLGRIAAIGFSGAVLVGKSGEVVLSHGYGLADRSRRLPVTAETVFDIGSITKQFTAAAILKLEMQGELRVTDPISMYFDGVPTDKTGITLHHLLTHSSGLRDGFGGDYEEAPRDWVVRQALDSKLLWAPGERYRYSNAGYSLLGAIVEIASGQAYEKYLHENLFRPAGMSKTGYLIPRWDRPALARGDDHGQDWGTPLDHLWAPDGPYWNLRANGGILSTVGDLYRWHLALEGDGILSKEAKKKYFTPHVREGEAPSFYGYGWAIHKTPRGTTLISHNGGNMIFGADFLRYVDEGVVILAASSTAELKAYEASQVLARIVFGAEYSLPPAVVAIEPARLTSWAGTYWLPSGAKLLVAADKGRLQITAEGQEAFNLLAPVKVADPEELSRLNERTAALVEKSARRDYGALQEASGGRIPQEQIRVMETERWTEWETRFGSFKSFKVLGSAADEEGMVTSLVRLDFERGSTLVRYFWVEGSLRGIRPLRNLPGKNFYPQSTTDFISFDLQSGATVRLRFEPARQGLPGALIVVASTGQVKAQKLY